MEQIRFSKRQKTMQRLLHVARRHRQMFDGVRQSTGLGHSAHWLLMRLSHGDTPPSQTELAAALEISPAAVAVLLKKLEADGYVEKTVCESDSRLNRVHLTDKGAAVVKTSHKAFMTLDDAILDGFSPKETETLCRFFERMQTNIDRVLESDKTGKEDDK